METQKSTLYKIQKIGAISGIISIIFYFSAAVLPFIPNSIGRLMGFAFPLLWIISFMGLYDFLKKQNHTPTLEIAYLFGIIGASIAAFLLVVQQANFMWHDVVMERVSSEEAKALYTATFNGANRVQAALDVSFDIFITISWMLFGLNIAKSKSFNKIFGWAGSLIALVLLVLNLYTFPNSPANSGLFDLGPLLGLWALAVYIWFTVLVFKKNK